MHGIHIHLLFGIILTVPMLSGDFMTDSLKKVVYDFMSRDYVADVNELNQLIRKKSSKSANLRPEMPPIPFTGDPWSKEQGNCTLLFSINPKWHEPGTNQYEKEFREAIQHVNKFQAGDEGAFADYLKLRTDYFKSGMAYGKHFTYLANRFRENWYDVDDVWSDHVLCMDCLPWFSDNTDDIDNERLKESYSTLSSLIAYRKIIEEVVLLTRPSRIQLNGEPARIAFEKIFDGSFKPHERWGMYTGRVTISGVTIPVLAHNFAWKPNGPNSIQDWADMADEWNRRSTNLIL
jgi:hypothetical protein